jgi:ankyrin repeat protein
MLKRGLASVFVSHVPKMVPVSGDVSVLAPSLRANLRHINAAPLAFGRFSSTAFEKDLIYAAAEGKFDDVKRLVEKEKVSASSADYDRRSALHLAVAEGHVEVVKYLVSKGADVNAIDRFEGTPLDGAITGNSLAVVQFLREKGAKFGGPFVASVGPLLS